VQSCKADSYFLMALSIGQMFPSDMLIGYLSTYERVPSITCNVKPDLILFQVTSTDMPEISSFDLKLIRVESKGSLETSFGLLNSQL
jgi:hypothetical protein